MWFRIGIFLEGVIILITFPASILLNRQLGPEARGILATVVLVPTVVAMLVMSQWERTLKAQITSGVESPAEVWARTRKYTVLISFVGVLLSALLISTQRQLAVEYRYLAILFTLFVLPLSVVGTFISNFFAAINALKASYAVKLAGPVIYFLAIILLGSWKWLSVLTALLAQVLLWVCTCLVGWFCLRSLRLPSANVRLFDAKIKILLYSFPPYVLEVISSQADIWFLSTFVGYVETGSYVAFRMFESPMKVIALGMINVGTGRVQWTNAASVHDFLRKGISAIALAGGMVMIGTLLLGKFLIVSMLGQSFSGEVWMLPYIVLNGLLASTAFLLLIGIQLQGQQSLYLKIQSADGILRIGLISLGCLISGAHGILIAICVASFIKIAMTGLGLMHFSPASMPAPAQVEKKVAR